MSGNPPIFSHNVYLWGSWKSCKLKFITVITTLLRVISLGMLHVVFSSSKWIRSFCFYFLTFIFIFTVVQPWRPAIRYVYDLYYYSRWGIQQSFCFCVAAGSLQRLQLASTPMGPSPPLPASVSTVFLLLCSCWQPPEVAAGLYTHGTFTTSTSECKYSLSCCCTAAGSLQR